MTSPLIKLFVPHIFEPKDNSHITIIKPKHLEIVIAHAFFIFPNGYLSQNTSSFFIEPLPSTQTTDTLFIWSPSFGVNTTDHYIDFSLLP